MYRTGGPVVIVALVVLLLVACSGNESADAQPTATGISPSPTSTLPPATTGPSVAPPPPPTHPAATTTASATYTVQPADTLFSIARRFGTTVDTLAALNGIGDPGSIRVGQVLRLPSSDGAIPTAPPSEGTATVVRSVDAGNAVALTFDAGSDAGFTAQILEILAAEGVRASFGVTGAWAERNPDLVRQIADGGHHFINHTYDHSSFTGLSTGDPPQTQAERWQQLDDTEAIVTALTGETTKPYFRPPYGDFDESVNADVAARGYRYNVMWTVDSFGWRGITADEIVARCVDLAEPGAIYIFHVGSSSQDAAALTDVIQGLRAAGYGFAYLPDVLP